MKTLTFLVLFACTSFADVEKVEVTSRSVFADGREFGDVGSYEKLEGTIYFVTDPENEFNQEIVDIGLAPTNEDGLVESHANFMVLQPVDPEKGSGTALLEVSNRGGQASMSYFNRGRGVVGGDGFLMRRGLTVIWVGWQHDVPSGLKLEVPVAKDGDEEITGLVRCDWVVDRNAQQLALGHRNHIAYPPLDPKDNENVLTWREKRIEPRSVIENINWDFTEELDAIERHELGFVHGTIYELVYRAANPKVVGLGLAAIRDTMSYAKYDEESPFRAKRGLAVGISQTGRFLRHFLYQGFNTDEHGRQVYDGLLIHTAGAGRGSFNHRFAQPSRDAHRFSAFFYPTDIFPFSGKTQHDPVTGRREGLLDLTRERGHVPKIFYTNTGYEYWGRAASLLHTSLDGSADVEPYPEERIYHLASAQHFVVPFPPRAGARKPDVDVFRGAPLDFLYTERAFLAALQEWVEDGVAPPPSAYPRIDDGTLVAIKRLAIPRIPGLDRPTVIHEAYRADYGPRWEEGIADKQPPELGPVFATLVSQVDELGNEVAGVKSLDTIVPLGSYFPWHLRPDDELYDFYGTFSPLPFDDEEAVNTGDSRTSVAALYTSKEDYMKRVRAAAEKLVEQRHLLAEDVDRVVGHAETRWYWMHNRKR